MPEISRFFGIIIALYWDEHNPPHFHARYGDFEASIRIDNLAILEGRLPPRAFALVSEWALKHQVELEQNWQLARQKKSMQKIEPLE